MRGNKGSVKITFRQRDMESLSGHAMAVDGKTIPVPIRKRAADGNLEFSVSVDSMTTSWIIFGNEQCMSDKKGAGFRR